MTFRSGGELPLVDAVRGACRAVADQARHVRINVDAIASYAEGLPAASDVPGLDPTAHFTEGDVEAVAAFVLCIDSINFGSGWWPTVRKRPGRSGSLTMASGLADRFRARGPWTAEELAEIDAGELAEVLDQDPDHEVLPLFANALRDLGSHVRNDAEGSFLRVVTDAGGSAVALATRLAGWDCFFDVSSYAGSQVPFFKRAQLTAADLQAAGVTAFGDLARLTAFADNLVPHVLTVDGVLELDPVLAARIAAEELLAHDSPEEIELRACALHAIELLVAATDGRLCAAEIDMVVWTRGQQPHMKARPRPRARTTAY
ncbi:MAG: queuosine salvage family protein [Acidimicrobiales bacterium]